MTEAYNMDCMEYMHTLPDKAFDLAVCDPPYFSGPERRRHYGRSISTTRIAAAELGFDFVGTEMDSQYFEDEERRFKEYKAQGVLFTPDELIGVQIGLEGQDEDGMHLHLL